MADKLLCITSTNLIKISHFYLSNSEKSNFSEPKTLVGKTIVIDILQREKKIM